MTDDTKHAINEGGQAPCESTDGCTRAQVTWEQAISHAGTDHAMAAQPVPPSPTDVRRFSCHTQEDGVYESRTGEHVAYADYAKLAAALTALRAELAAESLEVTAWRNRAVKAEAEREALRADAERYRHIRPMFRAFSAHVDGMHSWCATGELARMKGPTFDAAIDAAREGKA